MKNPRLSVGLARLCCPLRPGRRPERVRVTTNLGAFVIELQRDRAPLTVENFLGYVRAGTTRTRCFHRVIANFVIQGGGVGLDYKAKPTQKPIPNEAGNGLKNLRGTVGLARASGPHSGDCQFYVNVADNADLDPLPRAGATRCSAGRRGHGSRRSHQRVADRLDGPFKQDAPLQPWSSRRSNCSPTTSPRPPPRRAARRRARRRRAPPTGDDRRQRRRPPADARAGARRRSELPRHGDAVCLGPASRQRGPWAIDAFLAFLAGPARAAERSTCSATCSKSGWATTTTCRQRARLRGLAALTASGVPVYAIHGNRDFLLGDGFARAPASNYCPTRCWSTCYGVPTLLSHGDVFCTEDPPTSSCAASCAARLAAALPVAAARRAAHARQRGARRQQGAHRAHDSDHHGREPGAVLRAFRATGARA
jgi:cyclophilin family peptidyl-prolyl cis-trans isomerase